MNNEQIVIDGVTYGSPAIRKLSEVPQSVPHTLENLNSKPTKFGTFVAKIVNEKTGEKYSVYLPKYAVNNAEEGRSFVYVGLVQKSDNSGHKFHCVKWEEE